MSKYSLKELMIEDIAKAYDIFVDMDGVLTKMSYAFAISSIINSFKLYLLINVCVFSSKFPH